MNFTAPWVLFTDHPRSGLREFHLIPHSPLAYTIIGGGKSTLGGRCNDLTTSDFLGIRVVHAIGGYSVCSPESVHLFVTSPRRHMDIPEADAPNSLITDHAVPRHTVTAG
jgi:hypothetical protein